MALALVAPPHLADIAGRRPNVCFREDGGHAPFSSRHHEMIQISPVKYRLKNGALKESLQNCGATLQSPVFIRFAVPIAEDYVSS